MSSEQDVRSPGEFDGELPTGGRGRSSRLRSREDVDKNRKDLLMHILNRTGEGSNPDDDENEGNKNDNPNGKVHLGKYQSFCFFLHTNGVNCWLHVRHDIIIIIFFETSF